MQSVAEDNGSVSCEITVDGAAVAEQTSTGACATLSCSASDADGVTEKIATGNIGPLSLDRYSKSLQDF